MGASACCSTQNKIKVILLSLGEGIKRTTTTSPICTFLSVRWRGSHYSSSVNHILVGYTAILFGKHLKSTSIPYITAVTSYLINISNAQERKKEKKKTKPKPPQNPSSNLYSNIKRITLILKE